MMKSYLALLLVLDRHRDQNLEVILESNLSDDLSVKISLALVFDNLIAFLYSVWHLVCLAKYHQSEAFHW